MPQRTCTKCDRTLPETAEFFRKRGTTDRGGLRPDCKDCSDARDREYHERNRERIRAQRAAYRERTREQKRAADRAYAQTEAGKTTRRKAASKWNRSEAGRRVFVLASQRRRAAKSGVGADFIEQDWAECLAEFGGRCGYCRTDGQMTQDHVTPLHKGGRHTASNVIPACGSCNSRKFTSDMEAWFLAQEYFTPERLAFIWEYQKRTQLKRAA